MLTKKFMYGDTNLNISDTVCMGYYVKLFSFDSQVTQEMVITDFNILNTFESLLDYNVMQH